MERANSFEDLKKGFDLVLERLIEFKIYKKTPLVIGDGKGNIIKIPANELREWYEKQKSNNNLKS